MRRFAPLVLALVLLTMVSPLVLAQEGISMALRVTNSL
jgi:hypothetical protein